VLALQHAVKMSAIISSCALANRFLKAEKLLPSYVIIDCHYG